MKDAISEKGSALVMILIAVVLFAALGVAVNSMMRGGQQDEIGGERAKLHANEITSYGRSLRQAVQNLKISNGCTDADVSFEDAQLTGYEHTPPASDKCKVFTNGGGGMIYQAPVADWLDNSIDPPPALQGQWYFPARMCVPGTGTAESGCDNDGIGNEAITAVLPYIKKIICIEINNALGVTNPGGNPPAEGGDAWWVGSPKFVGEFEDGNQLDQNGAPAGCFKGSGINPLADTYHFYQVLAPR